MPPRHPHLQRQALAWLALLGVLLASLATWVERGRLVALVEPAAAQLPCLSYAPFRRTGHTPFDATLVVTPAQIEDDLRRLVPRTRCVRLYGTAHGLDAVPAIAQRLGLRVVLGAWLGRDEAANADEVRRAVALAIEHAAIVDRLIVGNEVLLRRELSVDALARWLDQARAQLKHVQVPVSYADVWEFWLRHDQLRAHVDIVTAHVLPYWEDDPVAVDDAVAHVVAHTRRLQRHFAPLPVWIGETGWPAAGRQRAGAAPGRVAQARFVRELVVRAADERLDFNLIEAFDQPWKSALEGRVGAYWGLFDAQGHERLSWRGAAREDERWWRGPLAALIGALAGALVGALIARVTGRPWLGAGALVLPGSGLVALLLGLPLAEAVAASWRGLPALAPLQMGWTLILLVCGVVLVGRLAWPAGDGAHRRDRDGRVEPLVPLEPLEPLDQLDRSDLHERHEMHLAGAVLATLFAAGCLVLPIVADPRYRELPWMPLAAVASLLVAHRLQAPWPRPLQRPRSALGGALLIAALLLLLREGPLNGQAWAVAAALGAMGLAALWRGPAHRSPSRDAGPRAASTASAISTEGAARSAE